MKYLIKFALLAVASMALAACTGVAMPAQPPAPATIAGRTVLDEKAMLAVEVSWRAAGAAIEAATDAGLIKGPVALSIDRADGQAAQWVGAMRAAYAAGNAADFAAALAQAQSMVSQIHALLGLPVSPPPKGGQ